MASRDTEFERGIGSLVNSADRAFKKAVNRTTESRTTRGGPARYSGGRQPVVVVDPNAMRQPGRYTLPNISLAPASPAAIITEPSPQRPPPDAPLVVGAGAGPRLEALPPPNAPNSFAHDTLQPWVDLGGSIKSNILAPIGDVLYNTYFDPALGDPNDVATPGSAMDPGVVTDPPMIPVGPAPGEVGALMREGEDPRRIDGVEPGFSMQELQEDRLSRDRSVLPGTDPQEQPVVAPGTEPPELDVSGLPGTSTETASGALSLDDYMKRMKEMYPDIDFTNPKQAEADANARRDLDRTAMLAQLALAAGMTKGAGPSWVGMGEGFEGAGAAYDKGFTKYQQALQDSADRYQKQQESQIVYDTARRKAAIDLYTSSTEQDREDRRTAWKEISQRKFDYWKEQQQTGRKDMELDRASIDKLFQKAADNLKEPDDTSMMDPAELAELRRRRAANDAAWAASIRRGEIIQPQYAGVDVKEK